MTELKGVNPVSSTIKVVELVNGGVLIAKTVRDQNGDWKLTKPMIIIPQQQGAGQQATFGIAPWPMFADNRAPGNQSYTLPQTAVLVVYDAVGQLKQNYEQATSPLITSGIGPGGIILGDKV